MSRDSAKELSEHASSWFLECLGYFHTERIYLNISLFFELGRQLMFFMADKSGRGQGLGVCGGQTQ